MAQVQVKPSESIDSALRRFKKQIQESGVLKDAREHEHYEKPSERRRKAAAARMQERYNALASAVERKDVDGVMANLSPDFLHDGITRQMVKDRLAAASTEYSNVDAGFTVKSLRLQGKTGYVTTEYHLAGDVTATGEHKSGTGQMEVRWCHELNDWYITGNLKPGSGGPPAWPF